MTRVTYFDKKTSKLFFRDFVNQEAVDMFIGQLWAYEYVVTGVFEVATQQ